MRKDTTFSDRKLTREEFSRKYWLDGKIPYQYHTAEIEDGRDEREQFLINNCRALFNMWREHIQNYRTVRGHDPMEAIEARMAELEERITAIEKGKQTLKARQGLNEALAGIRIRLRKALRLSK